jgi:acetolactate synthase I/II/III large subunit
MAMEARLGRGKRAKQKSAGNVAAAYLALLANRGVEYLFGNAGTDFAPLIEAYAQAARTGVPVPRPILATHENLAVTMAHGYGMVSRRIPAVMVHVSVGTANMICAALNAARENVAILLTAGRSPLTETGLLGSRDGYIHWAQEMYDQAGMIREIVKWDYELRNAEQLTTVVDRALAIAATEPRGPVYLSLPREVIAAPLSEFEHPPSSRLSAAAPPAPDAAAIAAAARMLAQAARPLIVTANAGRDAAAFAALTQFVERFAIPVVQHRPRYLSLPSSHPMSLGFDPTGSIQQADVIVVLEADVPWIPSRAGPARDCKVIQCGLDPLFARYPIRGFPCDLAITGSTLAIISALSAALEDSVDAASVARRQRWIRQEREARLGAWKAARDAGARKMPLDPAWVSHCIERAKDPHSIVINEYTLFLEHCSFEFPDLYFGSSSASGLGWGAGAALGAKLALPGRPVMAVLGDGAYMFSNPAAVHYASALHELPVLFVIMNNAMWGAVQRSTLAMYPDGLASKSNEPPFVGLPKLPAFEKLCEAAGGYGERVEDPASLPGALQRALAVVTNERRQALLNVMCGPGGTA